jgi:hypothetical protein
MASGEEERFHHRMRRIYDEAKVLGYSATYFLQMVEQHGGVSAARRLLSTEANVQYGFERLWELGRLDLTMEAPVLEDEFAGLFTERERAIAKGRLEAYGWSAGT